MGPALHPAIRHDVDPVAQRIDDFRKLVECGARDGSLRPPWFEMMMPVQPISAALFASSTAMMPFRQNCPSQSFTISER
jgi:hypothetical protein